MCKYMYAYVCIDMYIYIHILLDIIPSRTVTEIYHKFDDLLHIEIQLRDT